jgi:hypothetical protein
MSKTATFCIGVPVIRKMFFVALKTHG